MVTVASGMLSIVDLNDSKQLQLYIGSSQPRAQIYNPNNGTYTPDWSSAGTHPILTPQLFIAGSSSDIISSAKTITWYEDASETAISGADPDYTIASTGAHTLTINTNLMTTLNTKLLTCEVVYTDPDTGFDVTAKASFEFVKVSSGGDGSPAITSVLSNDTQTIPTDSSGNNGNFSGAVTTMYIYKGASDDSANWTVAAAPSSGVTGTLSGKTYTVTAMTGDTGYVDLTATRSGYPSTTKRFSLSKNKQGINSTAYWLVSSVSAISKSISSVYTPTSITVSGKSQTGSSSPANYSGRFIISESTDGSTYTTKYTSSADEASKTYTQSAGIKTIKVDLYLAGGTTTLLDEQIIPIVSDGATGTNGANAINAFVWTPDGNVIKNSTGTLTAQCDLYNGTAIQTSGVTYQWYAQDPTVSTDQGGGIGWGKLDSTHTYGGVTNYTTNKITIPAAAITDTEVFKCIASYSSKTYPDVCTVSDVTDPFLVVIVGTSTFKNGQGTSTFEAKLYQAGTEIDSDGTGGYTYTWYLYDSTNAEVTTWNGTGSKTGKSITVNASDINSRANLLCEVTK